MTQNTENTASDSTLSADAAALQNAYETGRAATFTSADEVSAAESLGLTDARRAMRRAVTAQIARW